MNVIIFILAVFVAGFVGHKVGYEKALDEFSELLRRTFE